MPADATLQQLTEPEIDPTLRAAIETENAARLFSSAGS
jgi:hypothetical protein